MLQGIAGCVAHPARARAPQCPHRPCGRRCLPVVRVGLEESGRYRDRRIAGRPAVLGVYPSVHHAGAGALPGGRPLLGGLHRGPGPEFAAPQGVPQRDVQHLERQGQVPQRRHREPSGRRHTGGGGFHLREHPGHLHHHLPAGCRIRVHFPAFSRARLDTAADHARGGALQSSVFQEVALADQ